MLTPFSCREDARVTPQLTSALIPSSVNHYMNKVDPRSVMVASLGFPLYGSYPFVSSFSENPLAPDGQPWQMVPSLREDTTSPFSHHQVQLWKRNEVARYPTIPYVTHAPYDAFKKDAFGCAGHTKKSMSRTEKTPYHKFASKSTHKNVKKLKKQFNKHTNKSSSKNKQEHVLTFGGTNVSKISS